jgi:hypothetical protein
MACQSTENEITPTSTVDGDYDMTPAEDVNASVDADASEDAEGASEVGIEEISEVEGVTYQEHIRPLLETHCTSCHAYGGVAPYAFTSWEGVSPYTGPITSAVVSGVMPPWMMNPDCRDTLFDKTLSDEAIQTFMDWSDNGFPEGNPADYVAPPPPTEYDDPGEPSIVVQMEEPYTADGAYSDDYRCFPITHEFEEDTFLTYSQVYPDQLEIVHHVIVYLVPPSEVDQVIVLDNADEGKGYTCFGDAGIETASTVAGWAPGVQPPYIESNVARRIPAGSQLVMQVHYNLNSTDEGEVPSDNTSVALWTLADGEYPEYLIFDLPIADLSMDIPAGESAWIETTETRFPTDATIIGVYPHMHLLGKELRADLIREDGTVECLSQVDDWDFNWQNPYIFEEEAQLHLGIEDTLRISCTFDNSAANQPVLQGQQLEPRDVGWGDGTYDEMCLNFITLKVPFSNNGESGVCPGFQDCNANCDSEDSFCSLVCMGQSSDLCYRCGYTGMLFGDCGFDYCSGELLGLYDCYQTCDNIYSDYANCIYTTCNAEYNAYYSCWAPHFEAGDCNNDFADCEGIMP